MTALITQPVAMQHKAMRLRGQIDAEERRPRDARTEAVDAAHGSGSTQGFV